MYSIISDFFGGFPQEFQFIVPIILVLCMLLIIYCIFYIYKFVI